MGLVAHGLGGVRDLPVPDCLFYWGASIVLVASFVLLGAFWRRPLLAQHANGWRPPAAVSQALLSRPLRGVVQATSIGLFVLVLLAALLGDTDPVDNIAPTWIYVVFWLGIPLRSGSRRSCSSQRCWAGLAS